MASFLTADSEDDEDGDEDENDETNIIHNYQHNLTIYKKNERVIIEIEEVNYYDENEISYRYFPTQDLRKNQCTTGNKYINCLFPRYYSTYNLQVCHESNNDDPTSEQTNNNTMVGNVLK